MAKTKSDIVPAKVKATVTYQRQEKYRRVVHDMVDSVFADDKLPVIELKPLKGRPGRYRTAKALADDVKRFFKWSADNQVVPTITSLSLYLGWYTDLFYNYIKQTGFSDILKKAKDLMAYRLEVAAEETGSPGPIFLLKASHGYTDVKQIDVNVSLDVDKLYSNALRKAQNDSPKLIESAAKRIDNVDLSE